MMPPSIFDYIKAEESRFETEDHKVGDNWHWNFRRHVQMIFHLKNGIFFTGANDFMRAFKNVMEPILNLAYWTEDIEVKDVVFFMESRMGKVLSFLLKKYHDEVYTREHDLDALFDEITESDIDYGGALVQPGVKRPEVIQLNSVAFCDQGDMLGGPVGLKFNFSPGKLREYSSRGWGKESNGADITIEELITLATAEKSAVGTVGGKENTSSGKSIEVYVTKGNMPEAYLLGNDNMDDWQHMVHVGAFYHDKDGNRCGVTLYKKKGGDDLKFSASKEVFQRALGRGYGEILLHPQVWTNFLEIHKMQLLEAGGKVIIGTDDEGAAQRNKIQDMDNLEMMVFEDGKRPFQVPTIGVANIQLYSSAINELFAFAQTSGAANDPLMGVEAKSGTTFKGQNQSVAQGRGSHDRRRGKRAKFIEHLYREMIIPDMVKEITGGKKFLATLSNDELTWVADAVAENRANRKIADLILENREDVSPEKQATFRELFKKDFLKRGNKQLVEILKDEFEGVEDTIGISIANKQKALADLSDKVLSIFQFVFQNPQGFMQAMQVPALAKSFENILEFSGMSIGDFSSLLKPIEQSMAQQSPITQQQAPEMALTAPTP